MPAGVPAADSVPLVGHAGLRARLAAAVDGGRLPASLLLHGPRGVGKQRLALWLAQRLLCTEPRAPQPDDTLQARVACGECQGCRYAIDITHPDLHWVFPRPRAKDADPDAAEVMRHYADAIAERVQQGLLYAPPGGTDAIYVATARALVRQAGLTPAVASRKVLVVGDAERMVPQEGVEAAANAFLKVLEEPPADTSIVVTSSEPGALLPTIRSRLVAVRVAPVADSDVGLWVRHPRVRGALDALGLPRDDADRVRRARGAPGTLLALTQGSARASAHVLDDAARSRHAALRYRAALHQGAAGARGDFSDTLDALSDLLLERARAAVARGDDRTARTASAAVAAVADARARADGNVSPQLLAAGLLRDLQTGGGADT